jgi:hypothetical protein
VPPRLPLVAASTGGPSSCEDSCELSCENGPAELSSIRGLGRRGFSGLSLASAPPGAIARSEVGYPDLGDPDTFCRRRVARWAGGADLAGCLHILLRAHPASPLARDPRPGASLSQDLPAGRLPVNPREGLHVPHAQGAFHRGPLSVMDRGHLLAEALRTNSTRGGWVIAHRLFPACGYLTGASVTPAD